eukprot:scaffold803_cov310-Pinguiococcus_pyrenoidosus.AAC.118
MTCYHLSSSASSAASFATSLQLRACRLTRKSFRICRSDSSYRTQGRKHPEKQKSAGELAHLRELFQQAYELLGTDEVAPQPRDFLVSFPNHLLDALLRDLLDGGSNARPEREVT